jgi:hypothetical protein
VQELRSLVEQQAQQLEQMGDRVRSLEDDQLEARRSAERSAAVGAEGPAGHIPGRGFPVAETEFGSLNARLYASARYLDQKGLDDAYTDSFGTTRAVDERQDVQFNKATLYSYGWMLDPKFRYLLYVWSSNSSQGLGAQVVVAGSVQYRFADSFVLGAGIGALPGTRSTSGTFPNWLGVDERLIVWQPLGDYGPGFGDFERHPELVTQLGLHFTFSHEDAQGQPDTEAFENVQLRLSDGNVIFEPGLFGPGVQIRDAEHQMLAAEAGLKARGYSLGGEYDDRWLDDFGGTNTSALPFDELEDHGFQLQASAMLLPDELQAYLSGSRIFGEYGDPRDARLGLNWFPFANKGLRWNNEVIYVRDSPVGGLSLPYLVGSNGALFVSTFEVFS